VIDCLDSFDRSAGIVWGSKIAHHVLKSRVRIAASDLFQACTIAARPHKAFEVQFAMSQKALDDCLPEKS
jgi:hypothetical protein